MASLLSHKSIVEICTLILSEEVANLPNKEWRFIAEYCVELGGFSPDGVRPPAEYFSNDGFHITVRKYSLNEALDTVFSPGEPLLLWKAAPEGFIEGILEVQLFGL